MRRTIALAVAVVAAGMAVASASAGEVSSNWAGYAAIATDGGAVAFRDVTGTWVQPKVRCTDGRSDGVAYWVGLGGYVDDAQSLEQLGTASECDGAGSVSHYAWWEILPAGAVQIPMRIRAGDKVTAAVVVVGQRVTMSLKNVTRGTRFSKSVVVSQPLDVSSAEWIAEAPSSCTALGNCRVVPLTNFGSVRFTNAAAIGNEHAGTITDPTWVLSPIELITDGASSGFFDTGDVLGSGVGAVPGSVSADGRSFGVAWQRNLTPG